MQIVRLKAQNKANVGLNPTNNTVYMSQTAGIPYVELSYVTCEDWYQNSHVKVLSGIYTGGRPTSIRVRDHYPHSIGTDWCNLSNLMVAETTWPFYATPRINVTCTTFPTTTTDTGKEFISETFKDNLSALKETCFYGARNTLITVGDLEVANSMRYDTIEPLAPAEDAANYYGDRIATAGVVYPYGTTPSGWQSADINYTEQTWEVEIELNQFTLFEGTANVQTHNYWKPYDASSYPVGLNYDPRLHAIEVDITSTYEGQTIHGKRWYYIWHVPQCWAATKAPKITVTTGSYSGPYDGPNLCGGWIPTFNYNTGYTASGGVAQLETMGCDINYKNILYDLYPVIPKEPEGEGGLTAPYVSCIDDTGNIYVLDNWGVAATVIKKYNSDAEWIENYTIRAEVLTFLNSNLYMGVSHSIQIFDTSFNLLQIISSYGTGDGQFRYGPYGIACYGDYIFGVDYLKIIKFDSDGNYVSKFDKPVGYRGFNDMAIDESGNIYILAVDTSYNEKVLVYDQSFTLLYSFSVGDNNNICYSNGYLYFADYTSTRKIEKRNTSGTIISSYNINHYGALFVDEDDRIFVNPDSAGIVSVRNSAYTELFQIWVDTEVKYVERNCKNYGIWDLSQIKAAYAVVTPNSFDPTNPATYARMIEYTGDDFTGITLTASGLLRFKNLYPAETEHYIYLKVDFSPMGVVDTQYSHWAWLDSSYGCSSGVGNQRNYAWVTLAPSCSEIPAGTATQYCNQTFSFDEDIIGEDTIITSLDDLDSGDDMGSCTTKFYWLDANNSIYPYCLASDGRTKAWMACGAAGVKKDYNNIDDATNVNVIGTPTALSYSERYGSYGFDYSTINLINRAIKDSVTLTTGFQTAYSPERIHS